MKKNRKILIFGVGLILGLLLLNIEEKNAFEIKKTQLGKEFASFPLHIQQEITASDFNAKGYKEKISDDAFSVSQHQKFGTQLHQLAFSKAFYSKDKLRLLQMAKEHLLYAKNMERQ